MRWMSREVLPGAKWVDEIIGWGVCWVQMGDTERHWKRLEDWWNRVTVELCKRWLRMVGCLWHSRYFSPVFFLQTTIDNTLGKSNSNKQQTLHRVIFWGIGEWQSTHLVNVACFSGCFLAISWFFCWLPLLLDASYRLASNQSGAYLKFPLKCTLRLTTGRWGLHLLTHLSHPPSTHTHSGTQTLQQLRKYGEKLFMWKSTNDLSCTSHQHQFCNRVHN